MLEYDHFFVSQQHSWDCGLACCNMVLRWYGDHVAQLNEDCLSGDERPLWTIELFHMLHSAGVEVEMCTMHRGINPAHHKLRWYENAHETELSRIQELFERSVTEKWAVSERNVTLEQLKSTVQDHDTTAILLIDVHTLLKRTG
jgi:ABC-type bacteriocin/lantibiotic exporter with double-glycine peptidase domain